MACGPRTWDLRPYFVKACGPLASPCEPTGRGLRPRWKKKEGPEGPDPEDYPNLIGASITYTPKSVRMLQRYPLHRHK